MEDFLPKYGTPGCHWKRGAVVFWAVSPPGIRWTEGLWDSENCRVKGPRQS